jgi:hypothetical protein
MACTRGTRAADGLARWFARQRVRATRWRGPDPVALPRAAVPASVLRRLCGVAARLITIVELPIVSESGDVMERHLGFVCGGPDALDAGVEPPPALVRRARVLGARARRRVARATAAVAAGASPSLRQPGLFDPRDLPGSRHAPSAAAADPDRPGGAHVGDARPLLVLEVRR